MLHTTCDLQDKKSEAENLRIKRKNFGSDEIERERWWDDSWTGNSGGVDNEKVRHRKRNQKIGWEKEVEALVWS